ncbi:MAG TPA: family 78 glycoside hydrolase catalytic domain [Acidobacteriaceae bacterium]|nr:family 78 glycoside hydrolase catalytic domain [Acidobacteriaceae bacterium]
MYKTRIAAVVMTLVVAAGAACNGQRAHRKVTNHEVRAEQEQSWTAKWITAPWSTERDGAELDGSRPMPIFRREFTLKKNPVSATLRIAGLGQYELHLNGAVISKPGLHQSWTDYRKTITYDSYDVTKTLKPGANAIGVLLGNGMYNVQRTVDKEVLPRGERYTKFVGSFGVPKSIAELRVKYADGTSGVIATDDAWKVTRGPILFSSTYGGEDFDARKLHADWDAAAFDDSQWSAAASADSPGGELIPAIAPDVRVIKTWDTPKVTTLPSGDVVYDFGQNFAGWVRVNVKGPPGAVLKLVPGELLNPDGSVSQKNLHNGMWWAYTLRGDANGEEWAPRFMYYGFRYVQVEWVGAAKGNIASVAGEEISSASPVAGSFESSDPMLNAIHALIVSAMHNNEVSIFTDCPHREKLGWLEETHLVAAAMMYNSDLRGLYAATAKNIADAQHADGLVPTTAPQYVIFGKDARYGVFDDSPEWGSAAVLAQWAAYRFYGDKAQLQKNYAVMQRYVKFLAGKAGTSGDDAGIVAYGLGDWYDIGPGGPGVEKNTTLGVTGSLMLYEDAATMQKVAILVGQADDAKEFGLLADRTAAAFNRRFWNGDKNYYDTGSQTANAMPLALGIVPPAKRAVVLQHVIDDIHAHNDHITTGEVGYPYLLRELMATGHNDLVLAMMERKDPPSYGSQLAAGATSLTEAWDANPHNSQDHLMLGGGDEWFYRALAGIDFDMSRAKDERITIAPQMLDGVEWAKASYKSVLGEIRTEWHQQPGMTSVDVTIPPGRTATLILPIRMLPDVPYKGAVNGKGPQMTEVRRNDKVVVYRIGPGIYHLREAESGGPPAASSSK